MKRIISLFSLLLALTAFSSMPIFAENSNWKTMPVLTQVYESSKDHVYLEWEGKADLYRISVDGKKVKTVKLNNSTIDLKEGSHSITITPLKPVSKDVDTKIEMYYGGAGGSIDLAALGLDPKDLLQGNQSKPFKLRYKNERIVDSTPVINGAYTDFDDRILLTFSDKYDSDVYYISIKSGKDVLQAEFDTSSKDAAKLVSKQNSTVTITLDQEYLKDHEWMVPELDEKYGFSVKLGKWPHNYVNGKKEPQAVLESKDSKFYSYTPYAAWKNAPDITYASQTSDGIITLKWEHEDNGLGCEYKIISPDKVFVVKKGNKVVGKTKKKEYSIKDLMNGKYTFSIVPVYGKEEGMSSVSQTVDVDNTWVVAPSLDCSLKGSKTVLLKWDAPENVDNYHITVYAGSGSLLRFVKMDFKKYKEFDVTAKPGKMEYTFTYDKNSDSGAAVALKFEIYASRETEKGVEQRSATSKQTITVN